MKIGKYLAIAGVTLASGLLLAACSTSSTSTSTYNYVYSSDPDSLDYLLENRATTSDVITNLVDGLLENDQYGNLVPSVAEDWTVSKDGLTYTYKLRKDAKWYTSEGEEYAQVKAQDFVTGLKYAADNKAASLYLVENSIKGLSDYVNGKTNDFSSVGVKAVDDETVEYTLNKPESYWNSKTTNGILYPLNEDFLKSKGKEFGAVKTDAILYNGPYLFKSFTSKSLMEFTKNPNYWDKDKVSIDDIKLSYFDGSDQEALVRNFTDGAYTTARLYPNSSSFASVKDTYKDNIVYNLQDSTSYYLNYNFNRQAYAHTSKTTDAQKSATNEAMMNKQFRQALNYAFDRTTYGAQGNGEDGASKVIRNTMVPPTFVQVGDKSFGDVVGEKLVNYSTEWSGVKLDDAQDAYYNPEKAKAKFAEAKAALTAKGVEFPIHLDIPVDQTSKIGVQWVSSFKQSVEASLGAENVVIDIQQMSTDDSNNITYFANTAAQKDYDLNPFGGWAPDYQDPSTYLDTFGIKNGGNLQSIGFEPGSDSAKIKELGLDTYTTMLEEADAETSDIVKRYEKYAEAQAWLIDNALTMPTISGGGTPSVTKVTPFSKAWALVGSKGSSGYNFKLSKLQSDVVTTKDFEKAQADWQKAREESNKKAQEELTQHVK